jgi:hypothetical protein
VVELRQDLISAASQPRVCKIAGRGCCPIRSQGGATVELDPSLRKSIGSALDRWEMRDKA